MFEKGYKYAELSKSLEEEILGLADGTRISSRDNLAKKYGVSRVTVEAAVENLVEKGLLRTIKGSGTFVNHTPSEDSYLNYIESPSSDGIQKNIAVMISNITSDIYPAMLRGVEDYANSCGLGVIVCNTDNLVSKQEEYIKRLIQNKIFGIIMVPAIVGIYDTNIFLELKKHNIPFVPCYRPIPGMYISGIYCNSFQTGYIATKRLIEQGCKKIAYASLPMYATSFDRYQGYLTALQEYNIDFNLIVTGSEFEKDVLSVEQLFSKNNDIDGIFAFNDRVAIEVYRGVESKGLKVGKDIKIISCDNTFLCTTVSTPLTSIDFSVYDIGKSSVKLLMKMAENQNDNYLSEIVAPKLVVRSSG